jgi:dihydroxyacetone kinase-like protein
MKMKKFINDPANLRQELLEGMALANQDLIEYVDDKMIVNKNLENADRVTIVSLGGTGHEPALSGFVGNGMLDISVPGDIFAAPGPGPCLDAIRLADKGKGVLFIVLNHAGDMLTGDMVMKRAKKEGLNVVKVVTQEDISNAPREEAHDRRGLVGCTPVFKVAGAAAAAGKSLEEVAEVAQRFADNMATIAVAARGATHPSTGEIISTLGEDEMEIGMGQHGEGGGGRQKMGTANGTAETMLLALMKDLDIKEEEELMVMINGVGSTTLMEQLIVFRHCYKSLEEKNIKIGASFVGEFLTVQEMSGFQMCIARLDDELKGYLQAPCKTPYYTV